MNKFIKVITIAVLSLIIVGCSSNTYGLTREEYKLVDQIFDAEKMVSDLSDFGYTDEEIEYQLRAALAQAKFETGE